jgi:hypothetical protein
MQPVIDPGIGSCCQGRKHIWPEHFQKIAAEKALAKPDTPAAATAAENAAPLSKTIVYSPWTLFGNQAVSLQLKRGNRKCD